VALASDCDVNNSVVSYRSAVCFPAAGACLQSILQKDAVLLMAQ